MTKVFAHAKLFSASASKTWMTCAAAPVAQLEYPNESSVEADLGTLVHKVGDLCLASEDRRDADTYIGIDLGEYFPDGLMVDTVFTDEMMPACQIYIDYCRALETADSIMLVEERVDYRPWIHPKARGKKEEEGFGTADCIIVTDSVCHVIDYKNGEAIFVDVVNNTQAMLYALGVYNELGFLYEFDEITMHIVQPRMWNICEWTISVKELLKFAKLVRAQSKLVVAENPEYTPSPDGCEWCRKGMVGDCDEQIAYINEITSKLFEDMTISDKRKLLDNRKLIAKTIAAVEENVKGTLENGDEFDGYKLVAGRCNRVWTDEAESFLSIHYDDKQIFNKKLIGIVAGSKLLTAKEMETYTFKGVGKPTLAPESDRRKALVLDVTDDFDAI